MNTDKETITKAKSWVFPCLVGLLIVLFVEMVCNIVFVASSNIASFWTIVAIILSRAVHIGIILFGIIAWQKQRSGWFKVFFVVYFSYILCNNLLNVFLQLEYFSYSETLSTIYGLLQFVLLGLLSTVGILFIIDYLKGEDKYRISNNFLSLISVLANVFILIVIIIGIAKQNISWPQFLEPIKNVLTISIFLGYYNKDVEPVMPIDETAPDQLNEPQDDEINTHPQEN